MTCQGCEQRRQWMKKQYDKSKERMLRVFKSLGIVNQADRAEQSTNSNQQRTERTD